MSDKFFLDTNIFVYSFDATAPQKKVQAMVLIQQALQSGNGIISTQVVQEFLNAATRKFAVPMRLADSKKYLQKVLNPLCQVYPDLALYEACLEIQEETDPSLIAGFLIQMGNIVIDASLRNKIQKAIQDAPQPAN